MDFYGVMWRYEKSGDFPRFLISYQVTSPSFFQYFQGFPDFPVLRLRSFYAFLRRFARWERKPRADKRRDGARLSICFKAQESRDNPLPFKHLTILGPFLQARKRPRCNGVSVAQQGHFFKTAFSNYRAADICFNSFRFTGFSLKKNRTKPETLHRAEVQFIKRSSRGSLPQSGVY